MYTNNSRIFEHAYITKVLGLDFPLQESIQMSPQFRAKVLAEHTLLQEFFLTKLAKMGTNVKNMGLTFKYIIEDPSRISQLVGEIIDEINRRVGLIFDFIDTIKESAESLGSKFLDMMKSPLEFLSGIRDKVQGTVEGIKGMSGWKQAALALTSLVGIAFLHKKLKLVGGEVAIALGKFSKEFLSSAGAVATDLANLTLELNNPSSLPLLTTALYSNSSLDEFFGFGKNKKKKNQQAKAKKAADGKNKKEKDQKSSRTAARDGDDKKKKSSTEKGDQAREDNAQKIDDAANEIPEEAWESDEWQAVKDAVKNMMGTIGKKVVKALAIDALVGAATGGWGLAIKYAAQAWGGAKFALNVMSKPLQKFAGGVKDAEAELKELEAGDDPTAQDAGQKKKEDKQKSSRAAAREQGDQEKDQASSRAAARNEAAVRVMVRNLILEMS